MANHSQQQIETSSNSTRTCSSECIAWLTAFGIEAVAIVMLNALTIIVYLKERSLRKRSMYLVINQAFADMFTGVSISILSPIGLYLWGLWTINPPLSDEFIFLMLALGYVSPIASLLNLGAISLERMHATFRPFKHRLVKKKIFGAVAAIVWITAGALSTGRAQESSFSELVYISWLLFALLCLLTIIVSYSSIAIKIVYGTQSHHRSATSRGRKLTKTLFSVTVVSLLLLLPFFIVHLCFYAQLNTSIPFHLDCFLRFMAGVNCLVNPLLYTLRIPEFKIALISLLHCRSQPQPAPAFPLNEM
ncbi:proteinase-activated receptor 1-like [Acropora millepora]|uniref:proteinase-activated receptor 1-like n=1 Tax=Acropora millepora TaxID=45264 RepID=UPI001CF2B8B4|nr:proteinase-activated receptor 1-like [Acropora millepora]XP_044166974.1 proteinase-activated receptor 1-like [Acropora millepora]